MPQRRSRHPAPRPTRSQRRLGSRSRPPATGRPILNVPLQALAFYEQAISVATDPKDEAELHELAGDCAASASEIITADGHLERAVELRRSLGDRSELAHTTANRIRALMNGRRLETARELLDAALKEFADLPATSAGAMRLGSQAARMEVLTGNYPPALELIEPVLAAAELGAENLVLADGLVTKGTALSSLGRFREGGALIEAGRQLAEANGFHAVHARAVNNALVVLADSDVTQAYEVANAGVVLARRLGQVNFLHTWIGASAGAGLRLGEWDGPLAALERSLTESTDINDRRVLSNSILNLLALRGERRDDLHAEFIQARWDDPQMEAVLVTETNAYLALGTGDLAEAERLFSEIAADEASPTGYLWPGLLASWRGDADGVLQARDAIRGGAHRGGSIQLTFEALTAVAAGLRGDRRAAIAQYQVVSQRLLDLNILLDDCLLTISMVYAVGPDDPVVSEGVARARATLARLRSRPLLDQLEWRSPTGHTRRPRRAARRPPPTNRPQASPPEARRRHAAGDRTSQRSC